MRKDPIWTSPSRMLFLGSLGAILGHFIVVSRPREREGTQMWAHGKYPVECSATYGRTFDFKTSDTQPPPCPPQPPLLGIMLLGFLLLSRTLHACARGNCINPLHICDEPIGLNVARFNCLGFAGYLRHRHRLVTLCTHSPVCIKKLIPATGCCLDEDDDSPEPELQSSLNNIGHKHTQSDLRPRGREQKFWIKASLGEF